MAKKKSVAESLLKRKGASRFELTFPSKKDSKRTEKKKAK